MEALNDILKKDPTATEDTEIRMWGENIAKIICRMVRQLKSDAHNMASQAFDGASVRRSAKLGVAAQVQRTFSISAEYIHCLMHKLSVFR